MEKGSAEKTGVVDAAAKDPPRSFGVSPIDSEVELFVPENDVADPEVTIVIPAVDEEITISLLVRWCREGLAAAGAQGEILIVDSSTDSTPELALAGGARVLRTPRRGLGRAYIDAIPYVRGRFIVMGDADCTYDFRRLAPFVEAMRDGNEFVMGSRFRGEDRKRRDAGAAPLLRNARDDVGAQPRLWQRLQRHPLRHARHHSRCVVVDGAHVAILGIRVRDGAEVGAHEPAHRRGAGQLLPRPGRSVVPPQAGRMDLTVPRGVGQPAGHARLQGGVLRPHGRDSCSSSLGS